MEARKKSLTCKCVYAVLTKRFLIRIPEFNRVDNRYILRRRIHWLFPFWKFHSRLSEGYASIRILYAAIKAEHPPGRSWLQKIFVGWIRYGFLYRRSWALRHEEWDARSRFMQNVEGNEYEARRDALVLFPFALRAFRPQTNYNKELREILFHNEAKVPIWIFAQSVLWWSRTAK